MKKYFYTLILSLIWTLIGAQYQTEEVIIDQKIQGTLYQSEKGTHKLAIIIPGSGPTDRNGNQPMMQNNSLKYLAEGLAANNIHAFIFDKVFLHEKNINFNELVFEGMVTDVTQIIQYFQEKNPNTQIILIGHSEGSLVGMLVTQKLKIDYYVSIAGAGVAINQIIISQIEKQAPFLMADTQAIFSELKKGNKVEEFNPLLAPIFNKESQAFLMSWMKYNPQDEIKKVQSKTLILQGTKDLQVSMEDANLLSKAKPDSKLVEIENMNHVFKEIKGDDMENLNSYNQPELPIHPQLVSEIVEFLNP